jgi:predicted acylesterase/phospholipase RssA
MVVVNPAQAASALECDIVMKGGITSGVVYPAAVVALAKKYRFRNIGGTSAGAIAAAVTAAAEYGRQAKTGTAFTGLAALPAWLAERGHLFGLFRPNRTTKPIFALLMRVLASPQGQNKLFAAFAAVFTWNWVVTVIAAVPGAILVGYGAYTATWCEIVLGVVLAFVAPFLISLWLIFDCLANRVPGNMYGICTGLDDANPNDDTVLTTWLMKEIDVLAGVDARLEPLTFGDLWGATARAAAPAGDTVESAGDRDREREARDINLEMITTNLTHGRPYRFPFETHLFYFDPAEFGKIFPARVVDHMVAKSRQPVGETESDRIEDAARMQSALPRLPLPEAGDLPIVVAARMSLSFPLLISAVPLWAVDWSLPRNQKSRTSPLLERCWFSDGGLSSNFPIHLFDGPIPTHPTFAIDLDAFPLCQSEDTKDECNNVAMPNNNLGGIIESWTRFGNAAPDLAGFFSAIVSSMQNWQDNMQSRVPGFRDRIVHVYLNADEGGLNLNMKPELLTKLAARGTCAGERAIANFSEPNPPACPPHTPQPTNWDNHRVVRFRTSMGLLENWIRRFCGVYTAEYNALVMRPPDMPPCSYPWADAKQQSFANDATAEVCALNARWSTTGQCFADGAPRPQPDLVTRPRE